MSERFTITRENMMLDLLLFQVHGVAGQPMLETTMALNPGLAALGPVLPLGTIVIVPDKPASARIVERAPVSLFG